MENRFSITNSIPDSAIISSLFSLYQEVFGHVPAPDYFIRLEQYSNPLLILCHDEQDNLIGFKIGYEYKKGVFYSWIGGVRPDKRYQGIASELMKIQHEWCTAHHYHTVRTITMNQYRGMLTLNLKYGFDIIGLWLAEGKPKIVMEKHLIT
jgi:GNAT superfamily N-acetyltransferase